MSKEAAPSPPTQEGLFSFSIKVLQYVLLIFCSSSCSDGAILELNFKMLYHFFQKKYKSIWNGTKRSNAYKYIQWRHNKFLSHIILK